MIVNLSQFVGKNVKVITKKGNTYYGYVSEYFEAEENENGIESIMLEEEYGLLFEIYPESIKSIEIVK